MAIDLYVCEFALVADYDQNVWDELYGSTHFHCSIALQIVIFPSPFLAGAQKGPIGSYISQMSSSYN